MRFLHTADLHLGAVPDPGYPWSAERSEALWNTFQHLIETASEQKVNLVLIAGDLFHHQPRTEECKRLDALFASVPGIKFVIIAGNHDYIRDTSPYIHFPWNFNVRIITSGKMTSVYLEDLNTEVHGLSYHKKEIPQALYDHVQAPRDGRYHILLGHGGDEKHIPIHTRRLTNAGFDYIALGHNHQPQLSSSFPLAYSGSPEPTDRNDMGMRGYILGDLDEHGCRFRWYPCSSAQYSTLSLAIDRHTTTDLILQSLTDSIGTDQTTIHRLVLKGRRHPDVHFDYSRIKSAGRIIEIQDKTLPDYDLQALMVEHQHDLIARYIEAFSQPTETKRETLIRQKALYYGLKALLNSNQNHS